MEKKRHPKELIHDYLFAIEFDLPDLACFIRTRVHDAIVSIKSELSFARSLIEIGERMGSGTSLFMDWCDQFVPREKDGEYRFETDSDSE